MPIYDILTKKAEHYELKDNLLRDNNCNYFIIKH